MRRPAAPSLPSCLLFALRALAFPLLCGAPLAAQERDTGRLGFYRDPALSGETVVFAAEGDLWTVPVAGGVARRLTTHAEEETDPVVSPDGSTLAFTARYEGPAEVYTMPVEGGVPVRRTYEADASIATTWTPDGKLVYTTRAWSGLPKPMMIALDLRTGVSEPLPLFGASEGAFDASGRALYFARPAFHGNVTRRYTGGTARDVWRFASDDPEAVELTGSYEGESHSPMWWEGRVYFVSDRDGTMNVWSMAEDGSDARPHTRHSGWDVKQPALDGGRIVYHLAGDLWLYDIAADATRKIDIRLASDFDQLRERWVDEPLQYLTSAHLHPEGESVVLTARGRVFVAPAGSGRLARASRAAGVRYRDVVFMPDGDRLLGLSDATGELEFVTLPADGVGEPSALTDDGAVLRFAGIPSPDGRRIAYDDNDGRFWVFDTSTGEQRRISEDEEGVADFSWSPDGRWLAYAKRAPNTFIRIRLYDTGTGATTAVTSDRVNSFSIAWHPGGEFLYFLSDRNLETSVGSPWGPRQPEPYFERQMEIYELALRDGLRSPFRPNDELYEEDEPAEEDEPEEDSGSDEERETAGPAPVAIDLEGIERRVRRVPIDPGGYSSLAASAGALFFQSRQPGPDGDTHLMALEIESEDPEPVTVVEDVRSSELSANGRKLLVRVGDEFHVIDARPAKADLSDTGVDLSRWTFPIDVREDWRQIYIDAWRLERDYFYDPGMHGVDWEGIRDKYLPLVDRVTTRDELSDVIGRVVGELSALHTSVHGGDLREDENDVQVATLGARILRRPDLGGDLIDYVYRSEPDFPDEAGPLADPALGVEAGDVIVAVNGVPTLEAPHLGALLRNEIGEQVRLAIRNGDTGASRDVIVVPRGDDFDLRYRDWEYTRRMRVEEAGEGSLGYVHLRAMGPGDIDRWYRDFYPVFDRQGLIVDVRDNNGGNIDSFILEKLMRRAWMYWQSRAGRPTWNMQYAFRGHMVVLVDQNTASDGEAFAEGFRRLGLGEVIGTRTWGGEIWLSSANRLSDGGLARAPMMGVYGPEGEWLIEQVGVIPDVEVDNLPHATFEGGDAQLEAAIAHLLRKIEEDPRALPGPPPYPNRAFRYPVTEDPQEGDGSGGAHPDPFLQPPGIRRP